MSFSSSSPSVGPPQQEQTSSPSWVQKFQVNIPDGVSSVAKRDLDLPDGFQPSKNDIVCGRGRGTYNNAGNVWFRNLVKNHLEEYNAKTTKAEKTAALERIVKQVREHGSRFIKEDSSRSCGWCELGDVAAREKVGNALREAMSSRNLKKASTSSLRNLFRRGNSSSRSNLQQKQQQQDACSRPRPQNGQSQGLHSGGSLEPACPTSCSSYDEDAEMSDVATPLRAPSSSILDLQLPQQTVHIHQQVFGQPVASLEEDSHEYKDHSLQMMESSTFSAIGGSSAMMVVDGGSSTTSLNHKNNESSTFSLFA